MPAPTIPTSDRPGCVARAATRAQARRASTAITAAIVLRTDAFVDRDRAGAARAARARPRARRPRGRSLGRARPASPAPAATAPITGSEAGSFGHAMTGRRPPTSSPRASSTSAAEVAGVAPWRSSPFVPALSARRDLPRHRQHLPPVLEREVRGDERARALARLDDDRRAGKPGDDPVARREAPRRGLHTRARTPTGSGRRRPRSPARARSAPPGSRGRCRIRGLRPSARRRRARRDAPPRRSPAPAR